MFLSSDSCVTLRTGGSSHTSSMLRAARLVCLALIRLNSNFEKSFLCGNCCVALRTGGSSHTISMLRATRLVCLAFIRLKANFEKSVLCSDSCVTLRTGGSSHTSSMLRAARLVCLALICLKADFLGVGCCVVVDDACHSTPLNAIKTSATPRSSTPVTLLCCRAACAER